MQIIRTNGAHSSREEEGEERGNFHAAPKRIALRSPRPASPHGRWQRGGRRRAPGEGGPAAPGAAPGPARPLPRAPRPRPGRRHPAPCPPGRALPRAAPARRVPPPPGPARGGGLRPAPSRRSLGALVGRAARLPPPPPRLSLLPSPARPSARTHPPSSSLPGPRSVCAALPARRCPTAAAAGPAGAGGG